MTGKAGQPVIIDPAVYYGHREMDLGMSRLFGGFDEEFYSAYHSSFPLESGWQERIDICNLYPLMVHVNLFGGSYLLQVTNILKHFT
jgi:fructosamine-3-kinase